MPFVIAQAGTSLYMIGATGDVQQLALPAGVTLDPNRQPRFAIINRAVVMVNSPSRTIWIDGHGTVRLANIAGPTAAPTLSAGGSDGIYGTIKVRYAFAMLDGEDVLQLSPFSETATIEDLENQSIDVSDLQVSSDPHINGRVIVRTTDNGSVFFVAKTVTNNSDTTASLTIPDAGLPIIPQEVDYENPPGSTDESRLELIVEWSGRLWGRSSLTAEIDEPIFSGEGEFWSFLEEHALLAPPKGGDEFGITAFMRRRDELGLGRRTRILKVIGSDPDTYEVKEVINGIGPCSQEAALTIRDIVYFLTMEEGVWAWGATIRCISDEDVHPWFTTDKYFNRARFPYAKMRYNPHGPSFDLCLAKAGSNVEDTWVNYDIVKNKWLGPHSTAAFARLASAGEALNEQVLLRSMFGAEDGYLRYTIEPLLNDDGAPIDFDVINKFMGDGVTAKRNWLQPSATVKPLAVVPAGTLKLLPVVGELPKEGETPVEQASINIDLSRGTHPRLRYLGPGRYARPRWRCTDLNIRAKLLGAEFPNIDIGKR